MLDVLQDLLAIVHEYQLLARQVEMFEQLLQLHAVEDLIVCDQDTF